MVIFAEKINKIMENTGLKEALEKTLDVFKKQCKDNYMGEENVKIKLVLPILEKLGWNIIDDIDFEHSAKGSRVDCCLSKKMKPVLLVEIKAYNEKRDEARDKLQIKKYCVENNVQHCVLTDGINWKLYINLKVLDPSLSSVPVIKIDCSSKKDDIDNNNKFKEFLCIENANYMLNRLDGIWKESFWELIKSHDTESSIDLLARRLRYEMMSKYVSVNIDEQIFRKYAERKIKIRDSPKKAEKVNGFFIGVYRETFGNDFDKNSLDKIKEQVTSFVQKLGWQVEIKERISNDSFWCVLKFENEPVSLILCKVFDRRTSGSQENDMNILMSQCKKIGVRYGAVTNGIRWEFYKFKIILSAKSSCRLFKEVKLEKDRIEQVADFLSMFSKDIIENLPDMVTSSRVLNDILNRNNELESEVLEAKGNDKKIEDLAKKLCNKVREMKPNIAEDVLVDYLRCYISWHETKGVDNEGNKKEDKGQLSVTFPDGEVKCRHNAHDTVEEVIKKIGVEKIFKLKIIRGKKRSYPGYPIVSDNRYVYDDFNKGRKKESKYKVRNIGKYFVMYHGDPPALAKIILEIDQKLECPLNLQIEVNDKKIN